MNYLYAALGAIVLLAADFFAGYHFGTLAPKLAAAKTELKQEAAEQKKDTKDEATVAQEGKTYAAAKDDDPALDPVRLPDVRVCYYAALTRVQSAGATGSGAHAPAEVRPGPAQNPDPGPNITPSIVHVGNIANAQVEGLQDYIAKVCQVKP